MPVSGEDPKKEAFRLYNDGKFLESYTLCNRLLETLQDPALEILAATNLFSLGKTDDAEVYFRDLVRKMPASSHVHSYLARVLEQKGDDGAIAEYAAAARLDPDNQDALRSYAARLLARQDDRGALPALKRLCRLGKRPDDRDNLAAALTRTGRAAEACALYETENAAPAKTRACADALFAAGRYREAADVARALSDETHDPALLRLYLAAQARADTPGAPAAYAAAIKDHADPALLRDYTRLMQEQNELLRAFATVTRLCAIDDRPEHRLAACELSAALGDPVNALPAYEALIRDIQDRPCAPEVLRQILQSYRRYLLTQFPPDTARQRFLLQVPGDAGAISLVETANLCLEQNDRSEARSWFYRAYRADFLTGGLAYAAFLAREGDARECEKVLLHILANVKKQADLGRVAAAVTGNDAILYKLQRLIPELIRRLEEKRELLGSVEREDLARAYLSAAADALIREDYAGCMTRCLCGLDVLPPYSVSCRPDDFLTLIQRCKEEMPADCPAVKTPSFGEKAEPRRTVQAICDSLGLTEPEQKVLTFVATHRRASETDLRRLLGTRRAAGIVNLLIRKAAEKGIILIEKKGMSAEGEVYEYCGT